MTTTLRFAWITNNAYDTLAIVDGDKVVSQWTITPQVAQDYLDATDIEEWCLNYPDCESISDYGDEVTGDELQERINFFLRRDISTAASTLGRKGGSSKSEAKAAAARENGKKGGRPTIKPGHSKKNIATDL